MKSTVTENGLHLQEGQYAIQGVSLTALSEAYGSPLYVYDGASIQAQYTKIATAFQGMKGKIKFAAKALTNLSILKLMKELGSGLDTVSIQEVHLGLMAGFKPEEIIFTPNCVSFQEIQEATELGVVINIDNISVLEQFGHYYEDRVPVCIRLNPHIWAGGHSHIQVGHIDSKFGISVYQMRHVQRLIKASNIRVRGLHVHTGSDILDPEAYAQTAKIMFELAHQFEGLEFIDFGSGFKVAYQEGGNETDVFAIAKGLQTAYDEFCKEYGREIELWFEPGKYLVSKAGYFLTKANVIKPTPATVFVGVNSGMNHLIRPMLYQAYHEMVNLSNPEGTKRIYTIVGNICETDTFGSDRKLSEVREGDLLALMNAGAYGYMMSSNYNSRLRPAEVLILDGEAKLIRRRETLEDLLRTQVEGE